MTEPEQNQTIGGPQTEAPNADPPTESPAAPQKPSRPPRMKWGKIIEEPEEEIPETPKTDETPKKSPAEAPERPAVDPRFEALKRQMARAESRQSGKRGVTEPKPDPSVGDGETPTAPQAPAGTSGPKPAPSPDPKREGGSDRREQGSPRKPSPEPPQAETRPAEPARRALTPQELRAAQMQAEERRRLAELEARARAAENERMRLELERDRLAREVRKKRRRAALAEGFADLFRAIGGGIVALFRSVRISGKAVVALLLSLVLSLALAVGLGYFLKSRVDLDGTGTSDPTEGETTQPEPILWSPAPERNAGIVSLVGATERSLRSEAERFAVAGAKSVSFLMRDEAGNLLFEARTDGDAANADLLTAKEILAPFLDRGIAVSCLLPMRYYADGDAYTRGVLYAYECALLSEIAEAGADEVILLDADGCFFGASDGAGTDADPDTPAVSPAEAKDELTGIVTAVHRRAPDTLVGIALTPAFLASDAGDRYLPLLASAFDLTLLDLRASAGEDAYTAVSVGISDHIYFFLRYGMRALIPEGTAEALADAEIYNWQEGTLPAVSEAPPEG